LPDPEHQLLLRDQPKYARFKGAETTEYLLYLFNFLPETSSILVVFDIFYRGEVGLAPLSIETVKRAVG
jgi:hypothetical protein